MINNMNMDLGHMQENVEDGIKMMRRVGRKSVLAYVGLLGMAYDITVKDSATWFAKAEARGERMEKEVIDNVTAWQEQLQKQKKHLNLKFWNLQKTRRKSLFRTPK